MPLVLVHGGCFTSKSWSLVAAELGAAVLAVDLPGRGRHRDVDIRTASLRSYADSIVADMDAAGIDCAAACGHSMGGAVICALAAYYPARVSHIVFLACPIAPQGHSNVHAMSAEVEAGLRAKVEAGQALVEERAPRAEFAAFFGADLTPAQLDMTYGDYVPESLAVLCEPVPIAALPADRPRIYIKLLRDCALPPEAQDRAIAVVRPESVIEIDAAHMAMISQPKAIASILARFV